MEISGNSIGTITICRLERGGRYQEVSVEGGSTVVVLDTCIFVLRYISYTHTHTHTHIHTCIHTHTHAYTQTYAHHTCIHMHICTHTHMHTHIHTHAYAYTRIYAHTHTHTHTHTHIERGGVAVRSECITDPSPPPPKDTPLHQLGHRTSAAAEQWCSCHSHWDPPGPLSAPPPPSASGQTAPPSLLEEGLSRNGNLQ